MWQRQPERPALLQRLRRALTAACPACGFVNDVDEKFCGDAASISRCRHSRRRCWRPNANTSPCCSPTSAGSLEIIADRDPEEAQAVLDPVLEHLVRAVNAFGGTVNRTMGDGLMALFGAPVAYEDHALRAASAAIAMQQAVRELVPRAELEVRRPGAGARRPQLGEVVLRASINGLPSDYSAIGETAHIASRIEHLAQPGTIALTTQTLKLLTGRVDVMALGPFEVKGLTQPIELYRLLGIRAERSRIRGPQDRPLSRFVGRGLEMGVLARPCARRAPVTASWSRWSANPASASRGCSSSSRGRPRSRAAWCWNAVPNRSARPTDGAGDRAGARLSERRTG